MARRSSGGRSARPAPRAAPARNPPAPDVEVELDTRDLNGSDAHTWVFIVVNRAPPPAPAQQGGGSLLGGIGSTIAQGLAFGTGSAVAHRAVDAVMGPRTIQHETVASQAPEAAGASMGNAGADACNIHSKAFQDCINNYGTDISKCQFYLDMLNQCRGGSNAAVL